MALSCSASGKRQCRPEFTISRPSILDALSFLKLVAFLRSVFDSFTFLLPIPQRIMMRLTIIIVLFSVVFMQQGHATPDVCATPFLLEEDKSSCTSGEERFVVFQICYMSPLPNLLDGRNGE